MKPSLEDRVTHVESLLALGRLVVAAQRPSAVSRSWFVLMMQGVSGELTIVRVDA